MRYAIDRYKTGTEKEVCAKDLYGTYIPQRRSRFFCPECGEPVFWCSRGGAQPDKFNHYTKNERSPECDKRVDGRSDLNLYERVGLPVHLENNDGCFQLSIVFPALGEKILNRANSIQSKVIISGGGFDRSVMVNQTNFFDSVATSIPVNFVPYTCKNFSINISSAAETYELRKKWSDYADGFDYGGAVFTYDETGGRKIRRGDSVSPGRPYYLISQNFKPVYSEIKLTPLGTIKLSNTSYIVSRMEISVSAKNEEIFSSISNYLKRNFGIWLLETPAEVVVLWPPVIDQYDLIPITSTTQVFCGVLSGNDVPSVFLYSGSSVSEIPVQQNNSANTIIVPMYFQFATLSVDRKYVGREKTFRKGVVASPNYEYIISAEKFDGTPISFDNFLTEDVSSGFTVTSNAKLDIYVGSYDKNYQHVAIRESATTIPARRNTVEVYFVVEKGVLLISHTKSIITSTTINEEKFVADLLHFAQGQTVAVPRWVEFLLLECNKKKYCVISSAIIHQITNGRIHLGVLRYLLEFLCCSIMSDSELTV